MSCWRGGDTGSAVASAFVLPDRGGLSATLELDFTENGWDVLTQTVDMFRKARRRKDKT